MKNFGIGFGLKIGLDSAVASSVNEAFEFTVDTTQAGTSAADQFTIPITSVTPYDISTSDGHSITGATGATTLTFSAPGTYTVSITDSCEGWSFANGGDKLKLLNISNWGVFKMTAPRAFEACNNMTCSATDAPIHPHTNMTNAFRACYLFNGAIGNWDVSQVTSLSYCFDDAYVFNQDLSAWDVSNVTSLNRAFQNATAFNGNITTWNVGSLLDMTSAFNMWKGGTRPFNQNLNSWNVSQVTIMDSAFAYCNNFNQPLDNWNVSNVSNMRAMFAGCSSFNQDIGGWNTISLTNPQQMFESASSFNQDLGSWNVSGVSNFDRMFRFASSFNNGNSPNINNWNVTGGNIFQNMFNGCTSFNQPLNNWDVSNATVFNSMFYGCSIFNQDITGWNTGNVTDMRSMFGFAYAFNQDISSWNVSSVTRFDSMFNNADAFNQPIGSWTLNTTSPVNMSSMFANTELFDQDLGAWNTSQVTTMNQMFINAKAFNNGGSPNINNWNTGNVTNMADMFYQGGIVLQGNFNQPIGNWNTSNVTSMRQMFYYNSSFDQPIGTWDTSNVTDMTAMFYITIIDQDLSNWNIGSIPPNSGNFNWNKRTFGGTIPFSTANYDAMLVAYEAQVPPVGLSWNVANSTYTIGSAAEAARTSLINTYGWTITDGGGISLPFIFTVENTFNSNPLSFTIPADTATYTYNYNVSTSDGQNFTNQTGPLALTFAGVGPYDITVSGTYPSMRFGTNPGNGNKIVDIKQFGSNTWQDFEDMFAYSLLSVVTATDTPNLSAVTSLKNCFKNATSYNDPKLNNWDVSTITTFETFLWNAGPVIYGSFNQDLSSWDVSNANTFYYMFDGCPMNQSFAAWNVTSLGTTNPTTAGLEFISPDTSQTPKMSTANYDATLISWAGQAVQSGVTINFRAAQYTLGGAAEAARNTLINTYGWTIVDAGGI